MKNEITRKLSKYNIIKEIATNKIYITECKPHLPNDGKVFDINFNEVALDRGMYFIYLIERDFVDSSLPKVDGALSCKVWKNNKNTELYTASSVCVNATNNSDGEILVVYGKDRESYVRNIEEFLTKFTLVDHDITPPYFTV
ncbi:MAG: hypothetical protein ACRCX8_00730 [Sarcina sp.]